MYAASIFTESSMNVSTTLGFAFNEHNLSSVKMKRLYTKESSKLLKGKEKV